MPEVLKFDDMPKVLIENHIEPFRDGYIPGAKVLCRERSNNGYDVFFHIPTPTAQKMTLDELEKLRNQVREWWQTK